MLYEFLGYFLRLNIELKHWLGFWKFILSAVSNFIQANGEELCRIFLSILNF